VTTTTAEELTSPSCTPSRADVVEDGRKNASNLPRHACHISNLNAMDPLRTAMGRTDIATDLVAEIAGALAEAGEYVARIDLVPTQKLVDFHWAAHQAGRRTGIKVAIDVSVSTDGGTRAVVRVHPRGRRPH
jgi:hypothetical protein